MSFSMFFGSNSFSSSSRPFQKAEEAKEFEVYFEERPLNFHVNKFPELSILSKVKLDTLIFFLQNVSKSLFEVKFK